MADTPQQAAAMGLMILMSALSEKCYAAGWDCSLEYGLWARRQGWPSDDERLPEEHRSTERERMLLRLLSEECGGWWMSPFPDKPSDPLEFVSIADWEKHIRHIWIHRGGFVERR